MVIASGTIIQINSRTTAGAIMRRALARVFSVAMVLPPGPRGPTTLAALGMGGALSLPALRRPSSGCRPLLSVNGAKDACSDGSTASATSTIGESEAAVFPLPVYGGGCRQAGEGRRLRVRNRLSSTAA